MATNIKDTTIAAMYDRLVLVQDGNDIGAGTDTMNIEIQTQAGVATATPLYISTDRIGIGTAAPGYTFHISGAPTPQLVVTDTTNTVSSRLYADDDRGYVGTATNHDFSFQTNNTRRMSILAGGNVGIGTTSPRCLLEGKIPARTTTYAAETASTWADITLWNPTDTINTATGIRFGIDATDLDDGNDCGAGIAGVKEHASNEQIGLAFITDDSGGAPEERMRIDNTGKVGIGTAVPAYPLEVSVNHAGSDDDNVALSLEPIKKDDQVIGDGVGILFKTSGGSTDSIGVVGAYIGSHRDNATDANSSTGLTFKVSQNDTTYDDAMTILSSGDVGIGTTDPEHSLSVKGNIYAYEDDAHDGDPYTIGTIIATGKVAEGGTNAIHPFLDMRRWTGTSNTHRCGSIDVSPDNLGDMVFYVSQESTNVRSGTERMRIDQDGKVGIGTTAPAQPLEVAQSATSSVVKISTWSTSDTDHSQIQFHKSSSATIGTVAATAANEDLGSIVAYGADTAPGTAGAAKILFEGDAAPDGDAVPGRISFWTSDAASNQKRMTIDDAGNVGIGTATPSAHLHIKCDDTVNGGIRLEDATNGTAYLSIWLDSAQDSQFEVYNGSAWIDAFTIQNATGVFSGDVNDTSDVGLKENIVALSAGLSVVNQLNPVTFDWKNADKGASQGFIAQEIEAILPNLVSGTSVSDGGKGKSIKVAGIVASLTKAIQELSAKVTALENA
jgi:hypothetical protein